MSVTGRSKWLNNYTGYSVREGGKCKKVRTKHKKRSELDLWLWLILQSHSGASVFYGRPLCGFLTLPAPHLYSVLLPTLYWLSLQQLILGLSRSTSIMKSHIHATGNQPIGSNFTKPHSFLSQFTTLEIFVLFHLFYLFIYFQIFFQYIFFSQFISYVLHCLPQCTKQFKLNIALSATFCLITDFSVLRLML